MSIYDDGNFRIKAVWKEVVEYWEGDCGYVFDAAWGVEPGELYVPAPQDWDAVTPEWMNGRRDEIVARLISRSHHTVVELPPSSGELLGWRVLTT
ncbi:hypothetical protein ACFQ9V_16180 [Leifsonia sp. NPDC056665]|uniref:hypothetical protein n=1 Tax=Leifsonia sp. NPDC056665 TaxID=3345901 RepID=UPI0036A64539